MILIGEGKQYSTYALNEEFSQSQLHFGEFICGAEDKDE